MSDPKMIQAKILRDFSDAGTETRHSAGDQVAFTEGAFANYHAAGLVEQVAGDVAEPAEPAAKRPRA